MSQNQLKRSPFSAPLTALGSIILAGALFFATAEVKSLQQDLDEKRDYIASRLQFLESLKQEFAGLKTVSLENVGELAVLNAMAVPLKGKKDADGNQIFYFTVWLDLPHRIKQELREVQYLLPGAPAVSREPGDGFRAGYRSAECESALKVILTLQDGRKMEMLKNLCEILNWQVEFAGRGE